jgi:hypothetical protein
MQFKQGVDIEGVKEETRIEGPWNEDFAGQLQVWLNPEDGQTYVVNGHHRLEAAKRLGASRVAVRFIKSAQNPIEARTVGALTNIAEGRGTPLDVAKLFRDTGLQAEDLQRFGVTRRSALARSDCRSCRNRPS